MIAIPIIIILLFSVIIIFSSKKFSPIPYFPSQPKDLSKIIKALDLKNNQTLVDLGAGDGIVIFSAAGMALKKNFETRFVAIEINPVLIIVLHLRRLFHPNKKNIRIIKGDIFKMKFDFIKTRDTTFYIYISPWYIETTLKNIRRQVDDFSLVSYMYPVRPLKNIERKMSGKNSIFIYGKS